MSKIAFAISLTKDLTMLFAMGVTLHYWYHMGIIAFMVAACVEGITCIIAMTAEMTNFFMLVISMSPKVFVWMLSTYSAIASGSHEVMLVVAITLVIDVITCIIVVMLGVRKETSRH